MLLNLSEKHRLVSLCRFDNIYSRSLFKRYKLICESVNLRPTYAFANLLCHLLSYIAEDKLLPISCLFRYTYLG